MFYLQKKKTVIYTLIIFILFVGMCLGYLMADSVSVCAKTKLSEASVRSVSDLTYGRQDIGVQEKSRSMQRVVKSGRRNGIHPVLMGDVDTCFDIWSGNIHFHSMTTVAEEFTGTFNKENIVRYRHQMDGEKENSFI